MAAIRSEAAKWKPANRLRPERALRPRGGARFLVDLEADRLDLTPFLDAAPKRRSPEPPACGDGRTGEFAVLGRLRCRHEHQTGPLDPAIFQRRTFPLADRTQGWGNWLRARAFGDRCGKRCCQRRDRRPGRRSGLPGPSSQEGVDIAKLSAPCRPNRPALRDPDDRRRLWLSAALMPQAIRKTGDLTGTIGLRDAAYTLPGIADEAMREVKAKKITARIESLAKPVRVAGRLEWRSKPVDVDLQIPAADTILAGNLAAEGIPLRLQVKMPDANLSLDGKAALPGTYAGKLGFSTADLSAFLAGFGQSGAESVGPLAFNGHVDAGPTSVSFKKATISVNGVEGAAAALSNLLTPLKITTALNFDVLTLGGWPGRSPPRRRQRRERGRTRRRSAGSLFAPVGSTQPSSSS